MEISLSTRAGSSPGGVVAASAWEASHSRCFFFSSRRRHTRCSRDWSSDVCSSDLTLPLMTNPADTVRRPRVGMISLGCPKNLVDSEVMLGELARRGYDVVNNLDSADKIGRASCRERV